MQEAAGELYTSNFDETFAVASPSNFFPGKADVFLKSSEPCGPCLGVLVGGGPAAGMSYLQTPVEPEIDELILGCG